MNIKVDLAHKSNYGSSRDTSKIKYLVIHYTANDGDTDENNGNYFENNIVKSSAHYFVDDDSVTQSVPDNYIAWHCGANTYKHQYCRNSNSIGIEICDDIKNGIVYPSAKTIENVLELVEYLMKKYNVPKDNVIRHYDVTGKLCPAYWCGTTEKNNKWKTEFWNKIGGAITFTPNTTTKPTETKGGNTVDITLTILKTGSKGQSVKALQTLLNGYGYNCGTVDGDFGTKTNTAVKAFQKAKGLTADGIVGQNTWNKLLK